MTRAFQYLFKIVACVAVLQLSSTAVSQQVQEYSILREEFDSNGLGWPIGNRDYAQFEIVNSHYIISHDRDDEGWMVTKDLPITFPSSYTIKTSIKVLGGVAAGYGLAFGGSSPSNIHVFVISDNGYYRYSYYSQEEYEEIIPWTETNAINSFNTNDLKINVEGSNLEFYINNNLVNQVSNVQFFGHRTGFIVYRRQKIEVDYLEITQREIVSIVEQTRVDEELPTEIVDNQYPNRHALVIGNSSYQEAPLRNPANDARAVGRTLQELGFQVSIKLNTTRSELRQAILEFGDKLSRDPGVGLFYYAGHGIQSDGFNYLIPVDAEINREFEIQDECIRADRVLRMMAMVDNPMNIVILDACRNNPYSRGFRSVQRGLAQPQAAPTGSIIAFATAPGKTASDGDDVNGLYTQQLIKVMKIPGLTIEEVFKLVRIQVTNVSGGKQVPWENSSLMGDFYFIRND